MNKFKKTVQLFSKLPGIGPRQAMRLVLAVLNWPKEEIVKLADSVRELGEGINFCRRCFNLSDEDRCAICADAKRDAGKICVVEKITDLESIEKTGVYRGFYHVLGGAIDPLDGRLPGHLKIDALLARIKDWPKETDYAKPEVILATNPDIPGETTALYLEEVLRPLGIKVSRLGRGLSSGTHLEYADQTTLKNAFQNRR